MAGTGESIQLIVAEGLIPSSIRQARAIADRIAVSYTHLRAHETVLDLVCRLLLEKKKNKKQKTLFRQILVTKIKDCVNKLTQYTS